MTRKGGPANNDNKQRLTEHIVDRAAKRARRWLWVKIAALIAVIALIYFLRNIPASPSCIDDPQNPACVERPR